MVAFSDLGQVNQEVRDLGLGVTAVDSSLMTDLYQLTMVACYAGEKIETRRASFELFVRRLPAGFGYLIAMGLAQALEYLEMFRFTPAQIEALRGTGIFDNAPSNFWDLLATAKFSGDVWAVSEGTAVFANEPLLRVEAPLWQAQIVETYLLNVINYQTLVATRAARMRDVAGENATLLEFGTRRAFSPQGALWAARAALAGGLDATSNVSAALQLGQKPSGTMAHALVMALTALEGSESEAFAAFHRYFPGAPLLIDTYDSVAAAKQLATKVNTGKIELAGVRIDSGDLVTVSQQVRSHLPHTPIFASGDLDEWEIARLQAAGAEISGYGIGTKLVTGTPVNGVYKLVEIDEIPVMKKSSGKQTYPGRKQIWRVTINGQIVHDTLGLISEVETSDTVNQDIRVQPLLQPVMQKGERMQPKETIQQIRDRTRKSVMSLPSTLRHITNPDQSPVQISSALAELTQKTNIGK